MGKQGPQARKCYMLDFGLARQYVNHEGKAKLIQPLTHSLTHSAQLHSGKSHSARVSHTQPG